MLRGGRLWLVGALLVAPLLLGMGGGGAGPVSDTIPRPEENHTATLRDRQGIVTEVTHLACAGKTYLPLRRGEGTLLVPFARVQRVVLGADGPAGVAATVAAAEGQELAGTLEASLEVTGETGLGNFRVPMRGLAEIAFR
jgi:hypothetical protein